MDFLRSLLQQVKGVWLGMSLARRLSLLLLTAVCVAAVVGVGFWAAQPDYRVLFSGLAVEDAGTITAKLQAQSVPFRLTAGGTTILVPAEQVQQLRLDLAVEGLPSKGGKGYELFDESPLGMTPFLQHVNYGRALQAELAKTIMQLEPVSYARVHLTRPEPTPFIREQKPTTASVMLKLKPGASLSRSMSAGIVALVARGVDGLRPENVTLLDSSGRLLSEQSGSEAGSVTTSHLDYKREYEAYLASKAEEMLAQLLGPGRAIVRVAADINFKRLTETRETYDPEQRAIKKEKTTTHKTTSSKPTASGATGTTPNFGKTAPTVTLTGLNESEEDNETEYLPSRTVQERVEGAGSIERLTVAAIVDLSKGEGAAPGPTLTVTEAQDIIKQAIGFKQTRDEIKVSDVKLAGAAALTNLDTELVQLQRWQTYVNLVRNASLGVAALVVLVLGWLSLRRLRPTTRLAPAPETTSPKQAGELDPISAAAQRDPEVVARLLATWLEKQEPSRRAAA
jgi:flagellar M-ring protein FliF